MARASRVVVLALMMLAIIGLACGADKSAPAPGGVSASDYEDDDYSIGALTADAASPNSVVAGPIGGPVPPGAFDNAKGEAPSAATSSLHHFSAVAGAASAALAGFFYF